MPIGRPEWCDGWESWPQKLLDNWSFRLYQPKAECAMPGCAEETTVVMWPGGFKGICQPEKARPVCSLAHSLMIAAGEAD